MKKVLAFGTFDIFHPGHEFYLQQAKNVGDELLVIIARDTTVRMLKGTDPYNDQMTRLKKIHALPYVDQAYLGSEADKYALIEQLKPDIICLGYDQTHFIDDLEKELEDRGLNPEIIRIDSHKPHVFKSSKLRKK
ncbi:MAG: FAD synthase [Nanoarchaeota archaeon]|nr:FAD synthase [Nanoarchaeota archaeon]